MVLLAVAHRKSECTYLKYNVADVEDGKHSIVVVSLQLQVFLETCETGVADVCAINEAKEVQ